ncbi:hypothetical protein MOKP4_50200 [Mycobacterium avium subsp. hominissuis]|nr:hypothetical protein BS641_18115 [Mycobacterium avium subsp. hominissuis]ETZ47009.1 hypothetical protein L839_1110 [Mycobacterium avium MAV_120809_2495]ETZ56231.1 hypothetical protein L840_3990 [Mycobacterium sp. MAC_011194_8550]ETZ68120.1 hypothetical protein L841_2243 [Mycobacterium sp. MAC_080597_8934]KDP06549.1 hypothetical protein MAV100_16385 [Mycobacterium avium subsp. hominissuis 100]PBA00375.1 hypothetical protein CKJ74_15590 [Mycobacterium avium]
MCPLGDDAYSTLHDKVAALLHSLARNRSFMDGDKCLARAYAWPFIRLNSIDLSTITRLTSPRSR